MYLGDSVSCPKNCPLQDMTIFYLKNRSCLSDNSCAHSCLSQSPAKHITSLWLNTSPHLSSEFFTGLAVDCRRKNF